MADVAVACPSCRAAVPGRQPAADKTAEIRAAWGSAWGALKRLAGDPVGRLPEVHAALGEAQAVRVGLVYGAGSALLFVIGGYMLLPFHDGLLDFIGFSGVLKSVLFCLLPFGGTCAGSLAARKLFKAGGSLGGDVLTSGVAVLPISLAMPLNGLLGYEHYGAIAGLSLFASCLGVLLLHSGYVRIAKLSERASSLAIPLVLALVFWLGKSIAASILEGGPGAY
jgi:hypothetical protein